jgi:hypothetical protein
LVCRLLEFVYRLLKSVCAESEIALCIGQNDLCEWLACKIVVIKNLSAFKLLTDVTQFWILDRETGISVKSRA